MKGYITDPTAPGGLRFARDLPEPEPGPNEIVVEVRAYSVNRGELFLLQIRPDGWRPGQDLAGVVASGAADGSGPAPGTRVAAIVDWACWSERIAVPSHLAAALPETVSFEQGASLPIAGLTALRALRLGGSLLGRRVLVTGATGGVGQFAVQLATVAGAQVTAHVSSSDREDLARTLGADQVVTSLDDDALGRFDLVLDGVGGQVLTDAVRRLAPQGTAATYGTLGGPAQLWLRDFAGGPLSRVVGFFHAYPQETRGEDLKFLTDLIAAGRLKPLLGLVLPWEETPAALAALRDREVRGKAVLTLQPSGRAVPARAPEATRTSGPRQAGE